MRQPCFHQLLHDFDTQSDDFHRTARDEMLDVTDDLRRAGAVDAIPGHFSLEVLHRLVADRAGLGWLERPFAAFARIHDRSDDIWDHIPGTFDHHAVAYADVFFRDVIEIVQCCLPDDHAANLDRFQDGIRRQHARSPHVHADIVQDGGYFLGREFQSQRAARIFPHESQFVRQFQIVQLDHHAVHFEGDVCPHTLPLARAG